MALRERVPDENVEEREPRRDEQPGEEHPAREDRPETDLVRGLQGRHRRRPPRADTEREHALHDVPVLRERTPPDAVVAVPQPAAEWDDERAPVRGRLPAEDR